MYEITSLILEAAILIAVVAEGVIGWKHYQHTKKKYQRYKAKRIIRKALFGSKK